MTGPCAIAGPARLDVDTLPRADWVERSRSLRSSGWWFEGLWSPGGGEVAALWARSKEAKLLRLDARSHAFPSLSGVVPASDWFERATRDATGLVPEGHVDPRPFRFHESYPVGHVAGHHLPPWRLETEWSYRFVRHEGAGVFEIPVGPIHAGIIEPGHFRFTTVGELILDIEIRLNYTHKGTLALMRGRSVEDATRLAERLSGDNAAAHAGAFASACEAALGIEVPAVVQTARTTMVELERLHNHLGTLAALGLGVALAAASSGFQALREEVMRWNARLFGHRLLMNAVTPGGLRGGPGAGASEAVHKALPVLGARFERIVALFADNSGVRERLENTGRLSKEAAEALACVGPAARASGIPRDARVDAPCLAYPTLGVEPVTRDKGDVASRAGLYVDEVRASLALLERLLHRLPGAGTREPVPVPGGEGEGLAFVEASRGAVASWVRVADGRVVEAWQRDASFLNWRGLQRAVLRNIVPDFPLVNKSFNLSYSGADA